MTDIEKDELERLLNKYNKLAIDYIDDTIPATPEYPPEFEHAMRQAAYQLRRANGFDAPIIDDVAEGKIPNGGFNGS